MAPTCSCWPPTPVSTGSTSPPGRSCGPSTRVLEVRRPNEAWRRLFRVDLESDAVDEVGPPNQSVWEFDLVDDSTVVAIVSDAPSGYGWYHSRVVSLDLASRTARTLYQPTWHLEGLTVSPDGRRVAVVEGYSSDPGLLSGSIKVIDLGDGVGRRSVARPRDRRPRVRGATPSRSGTRVTTASGPPPVGSGWTAAGTRSGPATRSSAGTSSSHSAR